METYVVEECCIICKKEFIRTIVKNEAISNQCGECYIEGQPIKTVDDLNKALIYFFYRDDVFSLLKKDECGWLDGGCRSLMKAFGIWLGEDIISYYQIVKHPDEQHSEHALIRIGSHFIDGDGISTYEELHHRWLTEELVGINNGEIYIQKFNPEKEPPNEPSGEKPFYIEQNKILLLAMKLAETFEKDVILDILKEQRSI